VKYVEKQRKRCNLKGNRETKDKSRKKAYDSFHVNASQMADLQKGNTSNFNAKIVLNHFNNKG